MVKPFSASLNLPIFFLLKQKNFACFFTRQIFTFRSMLEFSFYLKSNTFFKIKLTAQQKLKKCKKIKIAISMWHLIFMLKSNNPTVHWTLSDFCVVQMLPNSRVVDICWVRTRICGHICRVSPFHIKPISEALLQPVFLLSAIYLSPLPFLSLTSIFVFLFALDYIVFFVCFFVFFFDD